MTGITSFLRSFVRKCLVPLTNRRQIQCPFCFTTFRLKTAIDDKKVVCPNCNEELPGGVIDYRDGIRLVNIAILGSKEVGKSHFIAVLIEWAKRNRQAFGWNVRGLDDETIKRYRDSFYDPVFRDKRTIDATRSGQADARTGRPLTFVLLLDRGWRRRHAVTLTFYDSAGEDLNSQDMMSRVNKYIFKSHGLIVLMDPLQLQPVREALGSALDLPIQNTDIEDVVQRTANLIHKANEIPQADAIHIPIAAAFTKIDAVLPLFPEQSALRHPSKHVGGFSTSDFHDVDAEMRSTLANWGGDALIGQIDLGFTHKAFFGISSLGCHPGSSQKIPEVNPIRILDPLLWHLSRHRIIRELP